jgi:DNA-binding winged helix-turn-helix (wHTH) protein/TolB-like protein
MNSTRFRFGAFEFDTGTGELRRDGAAVHLQSQPAQVLACLVERAGETVSREELRKRIWGTETFVDFDRGLNFCIAQVRSALDDDPVGPRFIRTLPKRGYQFLAPVERIDAPVNSSAGPSFSSAGPPTPSHVGGSLPSSSPVIRRARIPTWIWVGALLLGFVVLTGLWARTLGLLQRAPIVAVVRFDNESADPGMTRFADGLTDNVVEELTNMSGGHYSVTGNAQILRLSRDQRDLAAIGGSLHAEYVVLGQVQSDGAQTRILVHLIRLPDQTHLWVVRRDTAREDPLSLESGTAEKVGTEFSKRIIADSSGSRLPGLRNR